MTPELSRPFPPERIGRMGEYVVTADAAECAALARRMSIPSVLALRCVLEGRRHGDVVDLTGHLQARVVQDCIVTAEPFKQAVDERFEVRCVPDGAESEDDDPDSVDQAPYSGNAIDLGEIAAEQLALALDPYPRSPGAVLPAMEDEAHPFAALGRLRRD